ncbi:MAG TPA: vitamin B12-dependent ribonucleotide reductase, partial [Candidatus Saccharimonadales bacterium]|nr:vitamin B12-dependent ribonucleotide reductase [Candidatus Saccharimonadales bacterium]
HLVGRVADTITRFGYEEGYFVDENEADVFNHELKYILASQRAAFNSPVWFNIGVMDRAQQSSACFILNVEDDMPSILHWYYEEGMIFKGGSGAGVNLSKVRSSYESLSNSGGKASGPVSFMRGADSVAGSIASGGKTRRAAKMVILDVDHPDVEEFIWSKAREERKARVLEQAGFDMSLNGKDAISIQYQNANNSVRVTDDFMKAVVNDDDWQLRGVTNGKIYKTLKARELFREIAEAAWECADPGMQFHTTINDWHTTPNVGDIQGSNPCSEYMHLNNSSCNLSSINLLKYLRKDGTFDVEAYEHTIDVMFIAQEILVGYSSYPTEKIAETSRAYRQLGLGYANLGALLMAKGLPYDSEEGRGWAAALTALMTGRAYATSARVAHRVGPFDGYQRDKEGMLRVLRKHRQAVSSISAALVPEDLLSAAASSWDEAVEMGAKYGVRNAQASLLAPTGTIALMMDCDTTGIEPDLGLVKVKNLVGGGTMYIVNQTVPRALKVLGYSREEAEDIVNFINEEKTIIGAPHLKPEHLDVFACSMGENSIHYLGHVKMMAAVQPFLSGAISKTVNMPEDVTVEDVEQIHIDAWKMGLKAVAIYRDNCKVAQPLAMAKKEGSEGSDATAQAAAEKVIVAGPAVARDLPRQRRARTYEFHVADLTGFMTVGEYEDGSPGELFIKVAKQGSTLAGVMDSLALSISHGLRHGVPLRAYTKAFVNQTFAPAGMTDDPEIATTTSLIDYIFRRLAQDYLSFDDRLELGLISPEAFKEQQQSLLEQDSLQPSETVKQAVQEPQGIEKSPSEKAVDMKPLKTEANAQLCSSCGNVMQRAGTCFVCTTCGSTSGCS